MREPKVMLEVTPDRFTWTVFDAEGTLVASRTTERTDTGWRGTERAVVFENAVADDDLVGAIEDADACEIANAVECWR